MRAKNAEGVLTIEGLRFDPPHLSETRLLALAKRHFDVAGPLRFLEGERDQNCLITGTDGQRYVMKLSGAGEDPAVIDFQLRALLHIESRAPEIPVPRVMRGVDGSLLYPCPGPKGEHQLRMLTWLPGILYQQGSRPSASGLFGIGAFLARLNCALRGFSHPAAGHFMPWASTNGLIFKQQLFDLLPVDVRTLAAPELQRLKDEVYPMLPQLRSQVIHHDGHDANLLRASADSEQVAGIIDFGDMIYGPVVCDLAVSLSDFIQGADDPVAVAEAMCRGFSSVMPLLPEETDLLLDMVMARLILILQLFEFRRRNMKNPPDFVTSDQPAIISGLRALLLLNRKSVNQTLRRALIWTR